MVLNHQRETASRSRARRQSDSLVVRWEERKVRNLSRIVERNICQVKWQSHLHNDWVEGAAENVSVSGVGFIEEGVFIAVFTPDSGGSGHWRGATNYCLLAFCLRNWVVCVYLLRGTVWSLLNWTFKRPRQCFCPFLLLNHWICAYSCWPFWISDFFMHFFYFAGSHGFLFIET